ncbi:MAG: leucine-rich repeat domain-containing protein, partial [Christensenellales bacterium]
TLTLAKKTVDLSTATVESRFLPYTGNPVFPIASGEVGKYLVVNATCIGGEEHTDVGRYDFGGITLSLKDEVNFSLIGVQPDFGTVTVHVYDGKIYEYDKNCLVRYTGMESAVNVPEGTESVFNGAFDNNYGITELSLPDSIKSLSSGALKNMQGLQSLSLPFLGTSSDESSDGVFSSIFGGSVPEALVKVTVTCSTVIHNGAFKNCSYLKRIEYKNEVTAIGDEAFYGCSSLLYAVFPSASSVGSLAFYGCKGLEILDLPVYCDGENGTVSYLFGTNAGDNSYFRYALKELFLANGTFETVASNAFAGLSGLTKIVLPVTVQEIGYGAFSSVQAKISFAEKTTSDESAWTESGGKYHSVGNGAFAGFKGATLSLPETVTSIGKEAFKDATLLAEIRIPASVSEIEEYAFYGTSAKIVFADESAYSVVKSKTFAYYAGEGVILPSSVTTVESYAFINSKIRSAKMSAGISYGNNVYENCAEMIRAEIYGSVIPSSAFKNCVSLKTVRIDCAERIEGNAFYGCSAIEEAFLPSTVAFIGSGAFYKCSSLKTFVFAMNALPDIGEKAFFDGIKISVYVNDAELKRLFSDRFYPEYSNIDFYVA